MFGIIYGVYFAYTPVCTEDGCPADSGFTSALQEENYRVDLAWKVCVSANFLTGLINIFLGFFGELLLKAFPVAAMLVPLAGIGFTWLALNQIGKFALAFGFSFMSFVLPISSHTHRHLLLVTSNRSSEFRIPSRRSDSGLSYLYAVLWSGKISYL